MKFDKGCLFFGKINNDAIHFIIKCTLQDVETFYVYGVNIRFFKSKNDGFLNWKIYKNGEFVNEI